MASIPEILAHGGDEDQVAEATGVKKPTLRNWRSAGKGPPWFRIGNVVFYPGPGLREFVEARTVYPSPTPTLADAPRRSGRPRGHLT